MTSQYGARIVAARRYRIHTLTMHQGLFVAVLGGRKGLHTAARTVEARAREGVLVAPGTRWDVVNDPDGHRQYEAIALGFDDAVLGEFDKLAIGPASPVVAAHVTHVDDDVLDALRRTLPSTTQASPSEALLRHRVLEVLILLAERGWRFTSGQSLSWAEKVRQVVAQRPDAEWSVAALADLFHISESTLRRRLESSEVTLAALVREVRLETALGLLQTADLPVGDVARRCGWDSHSRFTAAFQQRWGVAPSVVRARLKESAQSLTESG